MQVLAKRLVTRPLIDARMDARLEGNMNGTSLIKMPDWLKSRKAEKPNTISISLITVEIIFGSLLRIS